MKGNGVEQKLIPSRCLVTLGSYQIIDITNNLATPFMTRAPGVSKKTKNLQKNCTKKSAELGCEQQRKICYLNYLYLTLDSLIPLSLREICAAFTEVREKKDAAKSKISVMIFLKEFAST